MLAHAFFCYVEKIYRYVNSLGIIISVKIISSCVLNVTLYLRGKGKFIVRFVNPVFFSYA